MPPSTTEPDGSDPVLAADGLTKHFPVRHAGRRRKAVHAVDAVDLQLRRGRVVALVGESGSGKSTVARLLAQLYPATSGRVLLHGEPVAVKFGRRFRAYCRRVQLIFQDPFASLNPVHTVGYVLRRSLRIHHPGLSGQELHQRLCGLLEKVHLNPPERFLDKFPHELSGGQRQRIAIARALGANPEVLLADEPVSMLDVSIRLGVLNLLAELKDDLDLAILYITHDIASARYFAEQTVVMYAGRVVERGDSEDVTQRPAHPYTKLLIASAPDPDALGGGEAPPARGEPPSLISPPTGCRFHPRCPQAMDRCRTETPGFFPVRDGHEAACWLYADEGGTS
ncbi:ABC transporter ATP-binding protein [Stackebrandtia nassauensis]|uniref:Oligopeptide/dipeptide ABC transporter, ATPase subunit n=1 Tax=Stackebrandtia nassauensis (strain DSM 44728 / CIP 108903 / NRRL B-16338 / NBRC 102104 / LLR-40K-21) TaxID=446470 RepID=D3Q6C6_STANL|nr:ABC transporter ATP-binding protein [Stackebrandtia nassauensis]ADD42301.1 oligopeptide/dipeptide ABC transporter, ATPase subunit [Stackebrandtia nassauensis DSM 44728]